MQKVKFWLMVCVSLCSAELLVACSQPKTESDLYGSYEADYDTAKEKLVLNRNGTFVQDVVLKATGKEDTTDGTWSYDSKRGYVTFSENFMCVVDGFGQLDPNYSRPKAGSVDYPAYTHFGRVYIGSSEGVLYRRL
jgi:hypothetical protein